MIDQLLNTLSLIGIFAFAVSGALFAAEKRMDILGFILIAAVTAIGGGSLPVLLCGAEKKCRKKWTGTLEKGFNVVMDEV